MELLASGTSFVYCRSKSTYLLGKSNLKSFKVTFRFFHTSPLLEVFCTGGCHMLTLFHEF